MTVGTRLPDPRTDPSQFDTLWLGPHRAPGVARLTITNSRSVDVKKSKGSSGSNLTDNGSNPSTINITLSVLREESDELYDFVRAIDPKENSAKTPLDLSHPVATMADVRSVFVKKIVYSPYDPSTGYSVSIECVQWFPAPKPVKGSTGSSKKGPKTGGDGNGGSGGSGKSQEQKDKDDFVKSYESGKNAGNEAFT